MNLRVSRPALIEAFKRQGKDVNNATQQEMRSLVCAQCHEEYYFKKGTNYLTFPFDKGQTVEAIEQYYDEQGFTDYVHKLSKAPILKAQHPGWSMFLQGPHGQHGVACADCHMPYKAEGGIKYSDHQIMSPLAKISSTCQTCHRESEENLRNWANENLRCQVFISRFYVFHNTGKERRAKVRQNFFSHSFPLLCRFPLFCGRSGVRPAFPSAASSSSWRAVQR